MRSFELTLAIRHLRSGGGQTLLTVSAVAAGVTVIIFISSLIYGILEHISEQLTDMLPHVTVSPREQEPEAVLRDLNGGAAAAAPAKGGRLIFTRIERQSQQRKEIENWRRVEAVIRDIPEVKAAAPAIVGQGLIGRGGKQVGTQIYGADPQRLDAVTPVTRHLLEGRYRDLEADEVVVSYKVAEDLRLSMGDRVHITAGEAFSDTFRVTGIYDLGQQQSLAYVTLRAAQSLFGTGTAVRSILVRADDLYHADRVADRIQARLPYRAESWSRLYPDFVSSLGAYQATAVLVSAFSLVASAFAIASVLIVSVLQKSRQIGILKSMGARRRQILAVFVLEGLGIAIIGAVIGAVLGCGVVWALSFFKLAPAHPGARLEAMFPARLSGGLLAAAMFSAIVSTVLAALLPARRAAILDPVQVMR